MSPCAPGENGFAWGATRESSYKQVSRVRWEFGEVPTVVKLLAPMSILGWKCKGIGKRR